MNCARDLCLAVLSKCKTLKTVHQVHALACKTGLETDPLFAGKILLHCASTISNAIDYARHFFYQFPNPDTFMYNTLIRILADSDSLQNALYLFIAMLQRKSTAPPDSFSFAFVLKSVANSRDLRSGMQLHSQAFSYGMDAHLFVGTTLISMYAECGFIDFARKVFDEMSAPNVVAWNAVLTACFRCEDFPSVKMIFSQMPMRNLTSWNVVLARYMKAGELELARDVFMNMPIKDDVSWSTMISGFAHYGSFDYAFEFFRELNRLCMRPNEVSLTGVFSACSQAGALEFGKILHGFVEKSGFLHIIPVNNALIDTYSKCGDLDMAKLVFETMPENKSIVSWTAMVAGYAMQGHGEEAIELFDKIEEESRVRPDGVTFISILYACSHAGLIEQGTRYFSKMIDMYKIEPAIEHYGCMVDLYGRAGKLKEAFEFVCQMPISPNAIIWRTLLGACSIHGDLKLAEKVKTKLSELDPNNSGDHVLLSNIYAFSGKWKDVSSLRRSMIDRRIRKKPGWSMIEVDKIMYSFVAGDKQNEGTEEAYEKLMEIMLKLRVEGGYVPEIRTVLHDIEEEEKEDSVSVHSEKLAVAFGLARLREGMRSIRVVKNLRTCRDCHNVMKLISRVYRVDIVLRDRSRFHSFRFGSCSCKDYW